MKEEAPVEGPRAVAAPAENGEGFQSTRGKSPDDEENLKSVARQVAIRSFRRLLGSSLLWAIPVSYLACSGSVTVAVVIGMLGDGYDASSSSFVSAVMVGFFLWGTMIFVATSYITIPALAIAIAVVRYALRGLRAELPG